MTPAIDLAKKLQLDFKHHSYTHNTQAESYGFEAVEKLGVPAEKVFKTLIVMDDKKNLAVAVLPVQGSLNLKQMARALKHFVDTKKVAMADHKVVQRTTGYMIGGVSPLGQKKRIPTVIDVSAEAQTTIYVSAGRRGLEIELSPESLAGTLDATFAKITNC